METEHSGDPSPTKGSNVLVAGLGAALQAVEVLTEFGAEAARKVIDGSRAGAGRAERGYHEAARRGDLLIRRAVSEVASRAEPAVNAAAGWADRQVVRRVAESMKPYLIEEFVPEVIDGVLPKIRADVVPVVIDNLANDERIQDLVATQSKDVLSRAVAEARHTSAGADDRVEALLRKLLGRGPGE
jgi:hypothetical protein